MNCDHRNIAIIGTTDGVPFFDDQRRGGWPFFFRVANLPDSLSTHMANVHMGMVSANEFYEFDISSGIMIRRIRAPKSLKPQLVVMTDDLYRAYTHGISTTDFSYSTGELHRRFRVKVILLFWTGDYPALALVSGTHSKTCHWCRMKSTHAPEVSRRCWGDYRCMLPLHHQFRNHGMYGPPEDRPPPASRTHEEFVASGQANESYNGPKVRAPYKESGIKEMSMLGALPLFDLVWDVLGDMMHIISGVWSRHVFEMLAGNRTPAVPKARKTWTPAQNRKLAEEHTIVLRTLRDWALPQAMKKVNSHTILIIQRIYNVYMLME
jgi:hypothetical protein